jgi:hypothetical protein
MLLMLVVTNCLSAICNAKARFAPFAPQRLLRRHRSGLSYPLPLALALTMKTRNEWHDKVKKPRSIPRPFRAIPGRLFIALGRIFVLVMMMAPAGTGC